MWYVIGKEYIYIYIHIYVYIYIFIAKGGNAVHMLVGHTPSNWWFGLSSCKTVFSNRVGWGLIVILNCAPFGSSKRSHLINCCSEVPQFELIRSISIFWMPNPTWSFLLTCWRHFLVIAAPKSGRDANGIRDDEQAEGLPAATRRGLHRLRCHSGLPPPSQKGAGL